MASPPPKSHDLGVLAFSRFFATMRFADMECRKKGIISKNGSLQALNSAVPILNGRKCNDFAHLLPFFVFYLSNDCKKQRTENKIHLNPSHLSGIIKVQTFSPTYRSAFSNISLVEECKTIMSTLSIITRKARMSRFNTLNSRSRLQCVAFIASAEKFFPVLFVYP